MLFRNLRALRTSLDSWEVLHGGLTANASFFFVVLKFPVINVIRVSGLHV